MYYDGFWIERHLELYFKDGETDTYYIGKKWKHYDDEIKDREIGNFCIILDGHYFLEEYETNYRFPEYIDDYFKKNNKYNREDLINVFLVKK